ncbi:MAG: hypothetical protein GY822_31865 [Deltaproteobacteria bacterium]|nr:hypothetical protein [Deltaproteobacteria bacterium]
MNSPLYFSLLLNRTQLGEAAACQALVQRYQQAVFSMLSRMILHSLVEDTAQDVFLKYFVPSPAFIWRGQLFSPLGF